MDLIRQELEHHRQIWSKIAKQHNWYQEPFFIQAWVNENGNIVDSVSVRGLSKDYILSKDTDEELNNYNLV